MENILATLLIAEYQVDKLRAMLAEKVAGYRESKGNRKSIYTFMNNNKLFRIRVAVDEMTF